MNECENDASVQARMLADEIGVFGWRQQYDLGQMVAFAARSRGESMESSREFMAAQWRAYRASAKALDWAYATATKFFSSAIWQDDKQWPWKPGNQASVGIYAGPQMDDREIELVRARIEAKRSPRF